MEKAGVRTRDIQFWSEKNQAMICVHFPSSQRFCQMAGATALGGQL